MHEGELWLLTRTDPELRRLDYAAMLILTRGPAAGSAFEDLDDAFRMAAALDPQTRHDLAAWLADRGHVALAIHLALAGAPARPTVLFLARGFLFLQMPERSLQALDDLPAAASHPIGGPLLIEALADLQRWADAEKDAQTDQLRRLLAHRRAAAAWRPDRAPTRPIDVVNLPSDVHRRRAIRRRFAQLGDQYRLVQAVDARSPAHGIDQWRDQFAQQFSAKLGTIADPYLDLPRDGSLGNQITALRLWQERAATGCVVMEDDGYALAPGVAGILDEAMAATDADLVMFNSVLADANEPGPHRLLPLPAAIEALCRLEPSRRFIGACGYALTPAGAQRHAEMLSTIGPRSPGLDFWLVASALSREQIEALPPSVLATSLLGWRASMDAAGWRLPLRAAVSGVSLVAHRAFGPARRTR